MKVVWFPRAWNQYVYWIESDLDMVAKINTLVRDATRDPFRGLGKPEPLRGRLQGWWSRRITDEHRLVYRVAGTGDERRIEISQCRFHYEP